MQDSDLLSESEAAKEIGYSSRWLAERRRRGEVKFIQRVKGGKVQYRWSHLCELMATMERRQEVNRGIAV